MIHVTSHRVIAAPIAAVYRLAIAVERYPTWDPSFVEVHGVHGTLTHAGDHFEAVRKVGGRLLHTPKW